MTSKTFWLKRVLLLLAVTVLGGTMFASSKANSITGGGLGPVIVNSDCSGEEWSPDIAYNSVHNQYLVVWDHVARARLSTFTPKDNQLMGVF